MRLSIWLYAFTMLFILAVLPRTSLAQLDDSCALPSNTAAKNPSSPGADISFPVDGTINALIVFVQHQDDMYQDCRELTHYDELGIPKFDFSPDYATECAGTADDNSIDGLQSWTEDQTTEWPVDLAAGPDPNRTRDLPDWAEDLLDSPGTTSFTSGSLSDLYNRMSNGQFTLTGEVWDYTYIPENPAAWYDSNRSPFENGAVKLSHEIISYVDNNPHGIDFSSSIWDQYTNGDGDDATSDGNFDMIILLYRFASLNTIADNNYNPGESGVTSLGRRSSSGDGFSVDRPTLGGHDFIDNTVNGSGVIVTAQSQKDALRYVAHEIGHRQFGLYHSDDPPGVNDSVHRNSDFFSIMNGSAHLGFSAGDRIKLDWANIQYIDASSIGTVQNYTLRDAAVENSTETDVLWLRDGTSSGCGDVIVEARMQSTYWDSPPGAGNEDGDGTDFYLPNEGLYIYKAPGTTSLCGAAREYYSSIPNGGKDERRKWFGSDINNPEGLYVPGFGVGDQYTPFSIAPYDFHDFSLDDKLAITNIVKSGNSFSFDIWEDFLLEPFGTKTLATYFDFESDSTLARTSNWEVSGRFDIDGPFNIDGATFTNSSGSNYWDGFDISADGIIANSTIEELSNSSTGAIRIDDGAEVTIENSTVKFASTTSGGLNMAVWALGTSKVDLLGNTLHAPDGPAVLLTDNADGIIHNNDIILSTGSSEPHISAEDYASVDFSNAPAEYRGFNKLKDGNGLYARLNGVINAGQLNVVGSRNHFCDSGSATLHVEFGGTIYAEYNYWSDGSAPTQIINGGTIYYNNNLGSANCSDVSLRVAETPIAASESDFSVGTPSFSMQQTPGEDLQTLLFDAMAKARSGRYTEATVLLKQVVERGIMPEAHSALLELGQIFKKTESNNVLAYVEALARQEGHPLRVTAMGMVAHAYALQGRVDEALSLRDDLVQTYPNTPEAYASQASAFLLNLRTGRTDKANQLLSVMQPRDERDERMLQAYQDLFEQQTGTEPAISRKQNATPQSLARDVEGGAFGVQITAYPNPFNPTTTIQYTLAEAGTVTLQVFDVLGREVATLVEGQQRAGAHEAIFEASGLPSGTYLYRVEAGGTVQTGRMLLLK